MHEYSKFEYLFEYSTFWIFILWNKYSKKTSWMFKIFMNILNIQVGVIPRCNEINGQHENTLPWRRSFAAPSEWGAASLACWEVYDTWS